MAVYDINAQLEERRKAIAADIRVRIEEIDKRIGILEERHAQIDEARAALAGLEAVLRRMAMLARAANRGPLRPALLEEFEVCKKNAAALRERAALCGVPLAGGTDAVAALIAALDTEIKAIETRD